MATPTATTWTEWDGSRGLTYWRAMWEPGTADDFTDEVIVDISALGAPTPTAVKVIGVKAQRNGDFSDTLEFNATIHQMIYQHAGQIDSSLVDITDFSMGPNGGRSPNPSAAGFVGDIILSTSGVTNGDELTLEISFARKTS